MGRLLIDIGRIRLAIIKAEIIREAAVFVIDKSGERNIDVFMFFQFLNLAWFPCESRELRTIYVAQAASASFIFRYPLWPPSEI